MNADEDNMQEELPHLDKPYNTYADRNGKTLQNAGDFANRDIAAGEEITDNYLKYNADAELWKRAVLDLRAQCKKTGVGAVSEYEKEL